MEGIGKIAIVGLWPELYRLVSEGLEDEYSPLPDLTTLIAGILGIIYGTPFVRKQNLLIFVNAIKGAIAFISTTSFLVRASSSLKRCLVVVSLISVLILSTLFILYLMSIHTYYGRVVHVAPPFIIFNIVVGALPSLSVVKAYRDKSREGILFYRTIISICNGICWFCSVVHGNKHFHKFCSDSRYGTTKLQPIVLTGKEWHTLEVKKREHRRTFSAPPLRI